MTRPKTSAKSKAPGVLERLRSEEAAALLHQLLAKHPELRSAAEKLATQLVSTSSIEEVPQDVHYAVKESERAPWNDCMHSSCSADPDQCWPRLLLDFLRAQSTFMREWQ